MREIKHLSIHQWLRSAIPDSQQPASPIGFLFLKLPPLPCVVLLVFQMDPMAAFKLQEKILDIIATAWRDRTFRAGIAAKLYGCVLDQAAFGKIARIGNIWIPQPT